MSSNTKTSTDWPFTSQERTTLCSTLFLRNLIEPVRRDVIDDLLAYEGEARAQLPEFEKAINSVRLRDFQNAL